MTPPPSPPSSYASVGISNTCVRTNEVVRNRETNEEHDENYVIEGFQS